MFGEYFPRSQLPQRSSNRRDKEEWAQEAHHNYNNECLWPCSFDHELMVSNAAGVLKKNSEAAVASLFSLNCNFRTGASGRIELRGPIHLFARWFVSKVAPP